MKLYCRISSYNQTNASLDSLHDFPLIIRSNLPAFLSYYVEVGLYCEFLPLISFYSQVLQIVKASK
jgi:hypothetical protein